MSTATDQLSGLQQAKLSQLRSAWREAVEAYGTMGENPDRLRSAINLLIELTDDSEAAIKAATAYRALAPYPVPVPAVPEGEDAELDQELLLDAMWDLFFLLVFAVQRGDEKRAQLYARMLSLLMSGGEEHTGWWYTRARVYAPLGLPLATCV